MTTDGINPKKEKDKDKIAASSLPSSQLEMTPPPPPTTVSPAATATTLKPIFSNDNDDDHNDSTADAGSDDGKGVLLSFADGFRDKVKELFDYFDVDGDGFLNFDELRALQAATTTTTMENEAPAMLLTEELYMMACQTLNCHPRNGLSLDALKFTYAAAEGGGDGGGGADIDKDHAKVFGSSGGGSGGGGSDVNNNKTVKEEDIIYEVGANGVVDISPKPAAVAAAVSPKRKKNVSTSLKQQQSVTAEKQNVTAAPPSTVKPPKSAAPATQSSTTNKNNKADINTNDNDNNAKVLQALTKLIEHTQTNETPRCSQDPPKLSHYTTIPDTVQTAYTLIEQGAQLISSTATKYTLVGKINNVNNNDQDKLGTDLLRGCELISASLHMVLQDSSGCSRALRTVTQRTSLAIFIAVQQLVQAFADGTALQVGKETMGAQKTGAVWEACEPILLVNITTTTKDDTKNHTSKLLPKGNRNAMRRELLTWTREINDTMEEFQEMIDMGPCSSSVDHDDDENDGDDSYDDDDLFGGNGEDQYNDHDLPIAQACLGLLKNSRGNMKISLETCDIVGDKVNESEAEEHLDAIRKIHCLARVIGEGATDLGSLMYPPLQERGELTKQFQKQVTAIKELQDLILALNGIPSRISELANILLTAADVREGEFNSGMCNNSQT